MTQPGSIYQHAKRPEWGYCTVIETHDDRTTFKFDDGLKRTILHDHLEMMQRVDLEETKAAEVHKRIAKHSPAKVAAGTGKPKAKRAAAKRPAPPAPTEAS